MIAVERLPAWCAQGTGSGGVRLQVILRNCLISLLFLFLIELAFLFFEFLVLVIFFKRVWKRGSRGAVSCDLLVLLTFLNTSSSDIEMKLKPS